MTLERVKSASGPNRDYAALANRSIPRHIAELTAETVFGGERLMDRIFIVGNGGSGKSWLAKKLAAKLRFPITHLDDLHWFPGFVGKRPRYERDQLVAEAAGNASWIIEGIYGSILKQVFPRITTLIWLDLADDECISNLVRRGQTDGGTPKQFEELLEYTRGYRIRKNHLNSFEAHHWFYEQHPKQKYRLSSRSEVTDFLVRLQ